MHEQIRQRSIRRFPLRLAQLRFVDERISFCFFLLWFSSIAIEWHSDGIVFGFNAALIFTIVFGKITGNGCLSSAIATDALK